MNRTSAYLAWRLFTVALSAAVATVACDGGSLEQRGAADDAADRGDDPNNDLGPDPSDLGADPMSRDTANDDDDAATDPNGGVDRSEADTRFSDATDGTDDVDTAEPLDFGTEPSDDDTGVPDTGIDTPETDSAPPCLDHCSNGHLDCGETGLDCGGPCGACGSVNDAAVTGHTLPAALSCQQATTATVTLQNTGDTTWYRAGQDGYKLGYVGDNANPFLPPGRIPRVLLGVGQTVAPGSSVTFSVPLRAPAVPGAYSAQLRMLLEGVAWFGATASQPVTVTCDGGGACTFPQGVPEGDFTGGSGNDGGIAAQVNDVMASLSGCSIGSDCVIGDSYPTGQSWFDAVNSALRDLGLCAGQHEEGHTDEIAVSNTGCTGRWYGYHIYNYGGSKVVWNPGAQRGWWTIEPTWCP